MHDKLGKRLTNMYRCGKLTSLSNEYRDLVRTDAFQADDECVSREVYREGFQGRGAH